MSDKTRKVVGKVQEVHGRQVLASVRFCVPNAVSFFVWIPLDFFPSGISHPHMIEAVISHGGKCLSVTVLGKLLAEGYVHQVLDNDVVIDVLPVDGAVRERYGVPSSVFAPGSVIWPGAPIQLHALSDDGGYTVSVYVPEDDGPLILKHL